MDVYPAVFAGRVETRARLDFEPKSYFEMASNYDDAIASYKIKNRFYSGLTKTREIFIHGFT